MVSGNDEIVDDNNNNIIFVDDVGVTHGPITTSYDPETGSYASSTWMTRNGAASSSENVDPANDDDMAMISNLLFRAVASSDYTALVTLYANHARISILQFLQMKRRWSGHSHHHNDSDSHEYGAEEKMDEFLQQLSESQQRRDRHSRSSENSRIGYNRRPNGRSSSSWVKSRFHGSDSDECYVSLLSELTQFLVEQHQQQQQQQTRSSAQSPQDNHAVSSSVPQQQQKQPLFARPINKKPKSTAAVSEPEPTSSMPTCASYEAERLLQDTASVLSDTRPPANFVVYNNNNNNGTTTTKGSSSNVQPLFDGSVANSTPPPIGATTATGGGAISSAGAGTILHLACALDVPLCLAFVLSMGADARACHTAFRRLLIHEAACNGSINCLHLLLELGQQYDKQYNINNTGKQDFYEAAAAGTTAKSPDSSMDFPLFYTPGRGGSSSEECAFRPVSPTLRTRTASLSYHRANTAPASFVIGTPSKVSSSRRPNNNSCSQPDDEGTKFNKKFLFDDHQVKEGRRYRHQQQFYNEPLSFVASLRLFRELSRQVQAGTITELDAARKVMFHATVPESSKLALAKSCTYTRGDDASLRSSSPPHDNSSIGRGRHPNIGINVHTMWRSPNSINNSSGRSDGHGNTPLHWAAFKNETECVQLLLQYNADPNARAHPSGWTPLHDAAYSNGHESIMLLLDSGARVDSRANSGATPLCFAAQEDAAEAAKLLLDRGADLTIRCAATYNNNNDNNNGDNQGGGGNMSRFSGYTPLHYCAHYNAKNAARVLLQHPDARIAMEVSDFNDRLPIHVAVARGSSDVLRELLRAGARVETRSDCFASSKDRLNTSNNSNGSRSSGDRSRRSSRRGTTSRSSRRNEEVVPESGVAYVARAPMTPPPGAGATVSITPGVSSSIRDAAAARSPEAPSTPRRRRTRNRSRSSDSSPQDQPHTPNTPTVSSPLLRSMIPSQPVLSSKPWNCLSQRSIDECRMLISEVEQNWTPDRHSLFTPADRKAVAALLLVGKRLELDKGIFVDVWPEILSFCGRGWFEKSSQSNTDDDNEDSETSTNFDDSLDEDPFLLNGATASTNDDNDLSLPTFC